ncbi:MAG: M20/M25/M40 family metallo-hydrolase [Bacteroidota bacterium]
MNYNLLKTLCSIHAPAGDEANMHQFLMNYIEEYKHSWEVLPEVIHGEDFQHCIVLVFGQPRTAVFAHIDSIGFTARYKNELVKIGGPRTANGYHLVGHDSHGPIEGFLKLDETFDFSLAADRYADTGTSFTFKPEWKEDNKSVQCCYMDNRLGVFNALKVAESLKDGVIVFSCWEEHGGGSVPYIVKYLWERFKIKQALISDITWITDGVTFGDGVVVSLRDSGLPRKVFTDKIRNILNDHQHPFQLEVESSGGSDGNEIQKQPFPIDWCFIGAAELNVHSPSETVHKKDIESMIKAYQILMKTL